MFGRVEQSRKHTNRKILSVYRWAIIGMKTLL